MNVKILDCTLRDGGYLTNKHFSENIVYGIINGLTEAGIDYVEIGFLQDDCSPQENVVFFNSKDAQKYIPKNRKNTHYTVLADYSRYSIKNLDNYDGQSFDVVRVCFFKKERKDVLTFAREVINKGYKLFIQPVDILGYNDTELLDLISDINVIEPEGFAIVDTFGSMYLDDLRAVFSIIHRNLSPKISIDFHSHNNLQMSSALSQEFLNISQNKRNVVVDSSIFGMGRGGGNAHTELLIQYINDKMNGNYDLDTVLDLIDGYILGIKSQVKWGYDVSMFLAGCYNSHVNNLEYLLNKGSLRSKDIRFIINDIDPVKRKRYELENLETHYLQHLQSDVDDSESIEALKVIFNDKRILLTAPGKSIILENEKIQAYIKKNEPIIISVNFLPDTFNYNFTYFSNKHRFDYWKYDKNFINCKKIITSNISKIKKEGEYVISFSRLVKSGWNNLDNSVIMLLRLLDMLSVKSIALAGFDGFSFGGDDYVSHDLDKESNARNYMLENKEIEKMFYNFLQNKKIKEVFFITKSRFNKVEGVSSNEIVD